MVQIRTPAEPEQPELPDLSVVPLPRGAATPLVLEATVLLPGGRTLPEAEIVWFDEKGGEIARGRTIDAATFRGRQNVARALAYYKGRIVAETTFVFEREPDCPCSCRRIEPRRTRRAKESNP